MKTRAGTMCNSWKEWNEATMKEYEAAVEADHKKLEEERKKKKEEELPTTEELISRSKIGFMKLWNGSLDHITKRTTADPDWIKRMLSSYYIQYPDQLGEDPQQSSLQNEVFAEYYNFCKDRCDIWRKMPTLMNKVKDLENIYKAFNTTQMDYQNKYHLMAFCKDEHKGWIKKNLDKIQF